jgi:hypothetical protein
LKRVRFQRTLVLLLALSTLAGCDGTPTSRQNEHPPVIQNVTFSPKAIAVGGKAILTAIATDANNDPLVFYWEAQQGAVPHGAQRDTVEYVAPSFSGIDVIQVTASDGVSVDTKTIRISVIESSSSPAPPLATPIPRPPLTDASLPAPTQPPVMIESPLAVDSVRVCRTAESGLDCPGNMQSTGNATCTETIILSAAIRASGLVISMTERPPENANWGFSLWEVEAYQGSSAGTNLAKKGMASASSVEPQTSWTADKAVDGAMDTRWSSVQGMANPNKEIGPQWLKIMLPQPAEVDRVVLKWQDAYALEYCVEVIQ